MVVVYTMFKRMKGNILSCRELLKVSNALLQSSILLKNFKGEPTRMYTEGFTWAGVMDFLTLEMIQSTMCFCSILLRTLAVSS